MSDWKRAVLLIEYDDGARNAFEFTDLDTSRLTHRGLPGPAEFYMSGRVQALRQPSDLSGVRDDALINEIRLRNRERALSGMSEIAIGGPDERGQ